MTKPTQSDINDAILTMLELGLLIAYRDAGGTVRFAKREWAVAHGVTALTVAEVDALLAAQEPQLMAQWN